MNKYLLIGVVTILIIAAGGFWYFNQTGTEISGAKTYTSAEYGFTLQYPASSKITEKVTGASSDAHKTYPEWRWISFSGEYGEIHITPTYSLGYGGMGCTSGSKTTKTLGGRTAQWQETSCGDSHIELKISFDQPPQSWKAGYNSLTNEGNAIIIVTTPDHLEKAKNIVSTLQFTQ